MLRVAEYIPQTTDAVDHDAPRLTDFPQLPRPPASTSSDAEGYIPLEVCHSGPSPSPPPNSSSSRKNSLSPEPPVPLPGAVIRQGHHASVPAINGSLPRHHNGNSHHHPTEFAKPNRHVGGSSSSSSSITRTVDAHKATRDSRGSQDDDVSRSHRSGSAGSVSGIVGDCHNAAAAHSQLSVAGDGTNNNGDENETEYNVPRGHSGFKQRSDSATSPSAKSAGKSPSHKTPVAGTAFELPPPSSHVMKQSQVPTALRLDLTGLSTQEMRYVNLDDSTTAISEGVYSAPKAHGLGRPTLDDTYDIPPSRPNLDEPPPPPHTQFHKYVNAAGKLVTRDERPAERYVNLADDIDGVYSSPPKSSISPPPQGMLRYLVLWLNEAC